MRCDEVKRELSCSVDPAERSALVEHLSACPECASWSSQVEYQDALWDATRPEEPPAEAFDALWGRVVARSSRPEPVVLPFLSPARWKRWGMAAAVAAQAAALLIGGSALLLQPARVAAMPVYELEEGTTLVVTLGDGVRPVARARPQMSESDTDTVAVELDVLNFMESLDSPADTVAAAPDARRAVESTD